MGKLTVGTYSEGNLLVVYEINKQVLPTAPSPTTTHLMVCILPLKTLKIHLGFYQYSLYSRRYPEF